MSDTANKFYLTTPIYYVNARPHIGHAYTTIAADVIARRHRLLGDDTFFLTGTDEHGQKIQRSAEAAGIAPQQFADEVSASFQNLWKRMGITNDDYIRTTEPRHKAGVQKLFRTLQDNDFIERKSYTGSYCVSDEAFVDAPAGTPCPDCGRILETVTEENYFFKLSEFQRPLIDLIESNELAIQPETRRNEVLSFVRGNVNEVIGTRIRLLQQDEIAAADLAKPENSEDLIEPAGRAWAVEAEYGCLHEGTLALSNNKNLYVPGALKDLSISRTSFKWGIPVPGDEKHVIYVWLDALANYMTAIGYGSDDPADQKKFNHYWPANLHLVGKEIIRFHCVYWPAFLLAAELPLPKAITAHGWLLFENDKMSKSKGNIVRTETILDAFGTLQPEASKPEQDLFAADVLRYFLLREIPFGNDGSFSFDALVQRYNSDLANGYGNLVSRTLNMIDKYCSNSIPSENRSDWTEKDWMDYAFSKSPGVIQWSKPGETTDLRNSEYGMFQTIEHATRVRDIINKRYGNVGFQAQLAEIALAIRMTDGFISTEAPWKLAKDPESRSWLEDVLYTAAESIRIITALLYPILPYATSKVWAQLGLGDIEDAARKGELNNLKWGGLKPGTKLGERSTLFPSIKKENIQGFIQLMNDIEQNNSTQKTAKSAGLPQVNSDLDASKHTRSEFREMPIASASATAALNPVAETTHPLHAHHAEAAAPETPQIAIDDFVKIDLRVAEIVVAERIPKADKLLRLEVDLGYERRQILSGIAQWYTPEELIGRRIVVIANLAPRKMRGLESHGMLLAASHGEDGKPVLATFGEEIALGSRLK